MENLPTFGAWMKRRRRTLDLTQDGLAQRAGYSTVTIRKVETGELRPSAALAEQLAVALEIAPEQRSAFVHFARSEVGAEAPQPQLLPPLVPIVSPEPLQFSDPTRTKTPPQGDATRSVPVRSTLVGRKWEWEMLQRVWRNAQNGHAQLVTITGEAGAGKTRLAEELLKWAGEQGILTASTRSYSAQGALAYAPITELLRTEALKARLSRLSDVWLVEVARLLPELPETHPGLAQPASMTEPLQRQRFLEALARAVVADEQPLLLLIDDLQWCDRETLDWLQYLLHFAPQAHLLVVGTVRIDEVGREHPFMTLSLQLHRTDQLTEIRLTPLSHEEATALATEIAGKELTVEEAKRLYHATEGNPLFVVEMVRAQANQETMPSNAVDPTFLPNEKNDAATLPPKIHAVIRSRLLQLSSQAQELTSLAAVIGRSFTLEVLAAASHQDEETLVNSLDELWQRQIVREAEGDLFDFSHDKIREVAYGSVSPVRRRLLHHRVAETLARVHAQDHSMICGQLAAHYELAGDVTQAVYYYRQAGEVAHRISAYEEAIALLSRGLQLLLALPESLERDAQELDLQSRLGVPLVTARGYAAPEVLQTYQRAWALTERLERQPGAPVVRALALAFLATGDPQQTHRLGQQLLELAQAEKDLAQSVEAHYLLGVSSYWMGTFAASLSHLQEAVTHYNPQWHRHNIELYSHDTGAICLVRLALTLWVLGYPEQAVAQSRVALALAQDQKHPFSLVYVHGYSAWLYREVGELMLAAKEIEAMLALCDQHRFPFWPPMGWVMAGALLVAQSFCVGSNVPALQTQKGEIQQGLAQIQRGLDAFESEELNLQRPYVLAVAAQAYATAGQPAQGLALVEAGLNASQQTEEHFWEAELHRLRALLLLAGEIPRVDEAEAAFQQALSVAAKQEAKSLELRAALSLARLWRAQGRVEATCELLAPVYNWFSEGLATADSKEARALLDALA